MNAYHFCASPGCRPTTEADNRSAAEGEDGYLNGTTGLPVGSISLASPHHCEDFWEGRGPSNHLIEIVRINEIASLRPACQTCQPYVGQVTMTVKRILYNYVDTSNCLFCQEIEYIEWSRE